jgi:hypothetical protein
VLLVVEVVGMAAEMQAHKDVLVVVEELRMFVLEGLLLGIELLLPEAVGELDAVVSKQVPVVA